MINIGKLKINNAPAPYVASIEGDTWIMWVRESGVCELYTARDKDGAVVGEPMILSKILDDPRFSRIDYGSSGTGNIRKVVMPPSVTLTGNGCAINFETTASDIRISRDLGNAGQSVLLFHTLDELQRRVTQLESER